MDEFDELVTTSSVRTGGGTDAVILPDGVGKTNDGTLLVPLLVGGELVLLADKGGIELEATAEEPVATLVLGVTPGLAGMDEFADGSTLELRTDAEDRVCGKGVRG
jgi:hypothetical protein